MVVVSCNLASTYLLSSLRLVAVVSDADEHAVVARECPDLLLHLGHGGARVGVWGPAALDQRGDLRRP